MSSRPNEMTVEEFIDNIKELLFISNFICNKKKYKEDRKILKTMVKDFESNNYQKYLKDTDDDE